MTSQSLRFGSFTLDLDRLCLRGPSGRADLRPKSFEVLRYLLEHTGRVVTKEEMLNAIWPDVTASDESLTQCVSEVRRAIADENQRIIKTVPRRGYLMDVPISTDDVPGVETPVAANAGVKSPSSTLPLPDRPSIAVLPFTNMSGDAEQEYFADGIVEDITTELSRFRDLFVIARNSSFHYKGQAVDVRQIGYELGVRHVLEGSVRRDGQRVRITAQLIDADSGVHRWAERFDRELSDIFAVQNEVARSVAGALAAHISKAEAERTLLTPPKSWKAYDLYMSAAEVYTAQFHRHFQADLIYATRRTLDLCLAMDPNFARAHVLYSATLTSSWGLKLNSDYLDPEVLVRAQRSAETAVQLDPDLPQAHVQLAYVLCFRGVHELAVAHVERALAINVNYTDWRILPVLIFTGHPGRAVRMATAQLRIDPFALPLVRGYLGLAYIFLRKFTDAVVSLSEFVLRSPNHRPGRVWLTMAYSLGGDAEAAKSQATELLRNRSKSC